jgi:methionine-rich copper-binding protein CopC
MGSMKTRFGIVVVLALVLAGAARAHTPLTSSEPANGASAAAAPKSIALTFGGDVRLTAVTLTDASGNKQAIDDPPTAVAAKFDLAVRGALAPGAYVVAWRAVGADTHVISGEIKFEVAAPHSH